MAASGAGVGGEAGGGAGGSSYNGLVGVAQCGNLVRIVMIAASAGINGITNIGAGGSDYFAGMVIVNMVKGDDQHIGIIVEGKVVDASGCYQMTVARFFKLPADVGCGNGGIQEFSVVTEPHSVLHQLELVGASGKLQGVGVSTFSPDHIEAGPAIEITI